MGEETLPGIVRDVGAGTCLVPFHIFPRDDKCWHGSGGDLALTRRLDLVKLTGRLYYHRTVHSSSGHIVGGKCLERESDENRVKPPVGRASRG